MLNVLALALSTWVFTATPRPLAQAGLDDILSELANQDAEKEVLTRAMLLSVSTQMLSQEKEVQTMAKWIVDGFGITLPPKARMEMKSDLERIFEDATNCWLESRRSRQKVLATLDHESHTES